MILTNWNHLPFIKSLNHLPIEIIKHVYQDQTLLNHHTQPLTFEEYNNCEIGQKTRRDYWIVF